MFYPLQFGRAPVIVTAMMQKIKKFLPLALPLFLAGCSSLTNLTSSKQIRNDTGFYPIEAVWESTGQKVRPESIEPQVLIGLKSIPMQPTPMVKNRWEAMVPVPADEKVLYYRIKFDYDLDTTPVVRRESKRTQEYRLEIIEPK
ncbi:MAG: hypothetical protein M3Y82_11340 [Verrucomicrobiota bacterium]|nr:hypothetical protein [Verrucomicrobiota bacterium]